MGTDPAQTTRWRLGGDPRSLRGHTGVGVGGRGAVGGGRGPGGGGDAGGVEHVAAGEDGGVLLHVHQPPAHPAHLREERARRSGGSSPDA